MRTFKRSMGLIIALTIVSGLSLAAAAPAFSQEAVVAKVNGREITEGDVRLAESEIGSDLGALPPDQRRRVLVEYLIENILFAEAAEAKKLGSGQKFDARMRYWQRRALRDTYFDQSIKGSVTEADARKLYDAEVAKAPPREELKARHILVESEDKAREVYEKIVHGGDFAEMARQFSKDHGSKEDGGNLGYFGRGRMVPQFEQAAFQLKVGEVSLPVESQFGWHLIKVEDKRERKAPAFDEIKDRLIAALIHRRAQEIGSELRRNAQLEFVDPALKAQVESERAIRPAPGAAP